MAVQLASMTLKGFKSIRELVDFEPGPINILIGANGAGKSNLISFFRFMSWMMGGSGNLQEHVSVLGGANALLHDGAAKTSQIETGLVLKTERGENEYEFRLFHAAKDTLVFAEEKCRYTPSGAPSEREWRDFGAGHQEAALIEAADQDKTAEVILFLLRKCRVFQFHDTSPAARIRSKWPAGDNRWLKEDAANLGPCLLRLREDKPKYYRRIVDTIRLLIPFFADFELREDHNTVLLRWMERGSDMEFDSSQASDGMLRIMALVTLLLQPEEDLPDVLILDEPELGLHPYAISIVAGLLQSVAQRIQVFVATQSASFVDQFDPQDIVVVGRVGRESTFHRLDPDALRDWLEEYSLAELWEKNVLGGRPST